MATKPAAKITSDPVPVEIEATLKVQLKKKEFLERVVDRSGMRKSDAKTVMEATLAILGEALAAGEEVNVPPFGKAKVNREKDTPRGKAYALRLVRNRGDISAPQTLADDDKDS